MNRVPMLRVWWGVFCLLLGAHLPLETTAFAEEKKAEVSTAVSTTDGAAPLENKPKAESKSQISVWFKGAIDEQVEEIPEGRNATVTIHLKSLGQMVDGLDVELTPEGEGRKPVKLKSDLHGVVTFRNVSVGSYVVNLSSPAPDRQYDITNGFVSVGEVIIYPSR